MYQALSRYELLELSGSLLDLATAGTRLANAMIGHDAPAGSTAGKAITATAHLGRMGGPVRRSHEVMYFAALAAWDHAKALSTLLRAPHPLTVSLASVARGGVEAFSRVHWLLEPSDPLTQVQRFLSLSVADLTYSISLNGSAPLRTLGGENIHGETRRAELLAQLAAIGLPNLSAKTSHLARGFLDAVFASDGAVQYSQLSSVAHAETIGVHAFVELDDSGLAPSTRLVLPRTIPIEWTGYLIIGGSKLSDWLAVEFQPPSDEVDAWEQVRDRAIDRFLEIDKTRQTVV